MLESVRNSQGSALASSHGDIVVNSQGTPGLREALGVRPQTDMVHGVVKLPKLRSVDARSNNEPHAIGHPADHIGLTGP